MVRIPRREREPTDCTSRAHADGEQRNVNPDPANPSRYVHDRFVTCRQIVTVVKHLSTRRENGLPTFFALRGCEPVLSVRTLCTGPTREKEPADSRTTVLEGCTYACNARVNVIVQFQLHRKRTGKLPRVNDELGYCRNCGMAGSPPASHKPRKAAWCVGGPQTHIARRAA
jgi:hypothetical protein